MEAEGPDSGTTDLFTPENPDPNGCGKTFLVELAGWVGRLRRSTFRSMALTIGLCEMVTPGSCAVGAASELFWAKDEVGADKNGEAKTNTPTTIARMNV